ncbi:flavin reductase family protein [Pseudoxanthomonas sp.]|uniref:flavin reductase family protein n=1 Tax=Pseudoxanthomonas sp. TaxID=1871049 RepID=UPI002603FB4E|nr:flavin reductase family protein [Pseudoxanthomonas sp.]WDS38150.1 MAG: flavin reductase family protein [Pseudoxanthomonas sp.]
MHFYRPGDGHGLPHDPFKSIIAPRPIGWIGSVSPDGVRNLAPYSFFNAFGDSPPIIGFSSSGWKDSVRNVEASGVFTWNLATRAQADVMNLSSAPFASDVDEFERTGLTPVPGQVVNAPFVAGSPASFECRLTQLIQLTDVAGSALDQWLVLGEVVGVHIDKRYLVDGIYDTAAAAPILRAGGRGSYAQITPEAMFEMVRPTRA